MGGEGTGRVTPSGTSSTLKSKSGGCVQTRGLVKLTLAPRNCAPVKLTLAPEKVAPGKPTMLGLKNFEPAKLTVAPENLAPAKLTLAPENFA
jgi:hypothetical protein